MRGQLKDLMEKALEAERDGYLSLGDYEYAPEFRLDCRNGYRPPNKNCIFHDVTQGDMIIPCGKGLGGKFFDCFGTEGGSIIGELSSSDSKAEPAYKATVGYDLATGLGSVDATNLFDAWAKN